MVEEMRRAVDMEPPPLPGEEKSVFDQAVQTANENTLDRLGSY